MVTTVVSVGAGVVVVGAVVETVVVGAELTIVVVGSGEGTGGDGVAPPFGLMAQKLGTWKLFGGVESSTEAAGSEPTPGLQCPRMRSHGPLGAAHSST